MLDLPTDRPRQPMARALGGEVRLHLPAPLSEKVHNAATTIGGTPFMVLLAAWQALLGRLCRTTDVPVGVAESGRHHPGTDAMVGCFINTVVMRTDLGGDPTGAELLARVREVALEAFAHAEAPFERVVDRLAPERNLTATPVVQALLNVLGPDGDPPTFPGLGVEPLERPTPAAKSDLGLTLAPAAHGYTGALTYRRDLFDPATAERIAAWYVAQLSGMLADLDHPVGAVPLAPDTGPELIGPHRTLATDTLHTRVERWVDRTPDAPAVIAPDGRLTYAELERLANKIAHALIAEGAQPDEPIGVLFEPSTTLAAALLGVLKAGAGYLPLDASYPPQRVQSILDKAGARILLTAEEFAAGGAGRRVLALDDPNTLAAQPDRRPDRPVRPEHLLHVIFTSGSTGTPKGIAVEHRSILDYLDGMLVELGDTAGGSFAVVSTIAADLGHICLHGALLTGGVVHLVAREVATDPAALAGYFAEHRVDVLKLVPSHMELLATHDDLAAVLPRKLLLMAGESLAWSLVDRIFAARPGLRVQSHYGPTETTMIRMVCELGEVPAEQRRGIVPLGRMLPNAVGWLVDGRGRPVPPGVPGELLIGGPGVARGYLGEPELTARCFVEHAGQRVFRTGDLLRIRADGRVEFRGRVDDQVKVRGYRVEPGEVATALQELPGVAEAVVLPVGDGHRRRLAAWLVPAAGVTLDAAELRTRLRERLPDYLVPASLLVIDRLPLNPNGKVDRAALPAPTEADRPARFAPRTPTEHRLAAVWRDILSLDELGIDDDFFALGGDSFAAVRAVRATSSTLRVIDLFTRPTVRRLAEYLDATVPPSGRLLHRLRTAASPTATMVCVPYGGGSAAVFQPLAAALPEDFAVLATEIPGHDAARPDEPQIPLPELVDQLAKEVLDTVTGPIILYGHCVGSAAVVALSQRLEAAGRDVRGVIVGGSFPTARLPGRLATWANRILPLQRWASDRLYRDILRATGGLIDDMDEAATAAALRGMRHDALEARTWFSAALSHPGPPLTAPLLCVVGERDRATELHQERYAEWSTFAERVDLATIPGGDHYFLRSHATELAALIVERVECPEGGLQGTQRPEGHLQGIRHPGLRAFYTVAGGQFVSMLGNALSVFALEVWAYQRSGRVLDLALVILLATLPAVLATPLGGALADRVDRRRIMLGADLVSGLAMAVLAVLLATGNLTLPGVCVIVTMTATATAFHQPAYLAAIAQLVPKPYLPQANAFSQLGLGVGTVLGPMAGGALLALTGLGGVVAVDVASFAIAVTTLLAVRFPDRLFPRREEPFRRAVTGGWRYLARRRPLLLMIGFAAVLNLLAAMALVALPPLVLSFAGIPALGLITTIGGLGAALGGLLMIPWGGTRRRTTGMILSVLGIGAGTVLMGLNASVPLVATGLALRMAALSIMNAHWLAIIQVKVGPHLQGRVLATNLLLALATQPIGLLAAAPFASTLSDSPGPGMAHLLVITGTGLIIWALLALTARPLRTLETTLPDAGNDEWAPTAAE
jgi:amino acid adenylation domain-containing protein